MLKKQIEYTDFMGQKHTEEFFFHLNKTELFDLGLEYRGGLAEMIQSMIATEDHLPLMREFKRLVLAAYGERSADGKRFMKSDEIRNNFEHHAAFDSLIMEFLGSEDAMVTFIKGILPEGVVITEEDLKLKPKVDIPAPEQRPIGKPMIDDLLPPAPIPPQGGFISETKTPPPLPKR